MPKLVEPRVYLIAETQLVGVDPVEDMGGEYEDGLGGFLASLNVEGWQTDATSDAEKLIEASGKLCYLSFSTDLNKNLTRVGARNNFQYIQEGLIKTKHGSVLEHASVTFAMMNVSRVFTHELVRHRVGTAFSQVSGRYVRADEISYWSPKSIENDVVAREKFWNAFSAMEKAVKSIGEHFGIDDMKDFTLKKKLTSMFRRLIGNGQANHIICTMNHRTIRHLIELRTSRHAEEEIRLVFAQVYELVKDRYPAIYADARIEEVDGYPEVTFEHSKV